MTPFVRGVLCCGLCIMAFQDYLGKDGYLEHTAAHWVEFPPGMCVLWLLLALGVYLNMWEPPKMLPKPVSAKPAVARDPGSPICDECGSYIPDTPGGGLTNKHHRAFCSLYDPEWE